jgi:hypothetical protein
VKFALHKYFFVDRKKRVQLFPIDKTIELTEASQRPIAYGIKLEYNSLSVISKVIQLNLIA